MISRPGRADDRNTSRGLLVLAAVMLLASMPAAAELSDAERRGKQIYFEGTSPGGGEITAVVGDEAALLPASAMPCSSCHGSDGLGRPDLFRFTVTADPVDDPVALGHRQSEQSVAHGPADQMSCPCLTNVVTPGQGARKLARWESLPGCSVDHGQAIWMQLLFPDRIELPETECRCSVEIFEVLTHRMLIERLEQEGIGPFFLNDSVCFLIQFNPLIVVHFYTGFLDQSGSFVVIEYIPPAELFGLIIGKWLSIGVGGILARVERRSACLA